MYKIVEYRKNYDNKVKAFLTAIFIDEFGFEECRDYIQSENINKEYKATGGNFWVALDKNRQVVGTIAGKVLDNHTLEVKRVYVKKEFRGNGISQKLYDILEQFAVENGFEKLYLGTYEKMQRAINFYYKNNFIYDYSNTSTSNGEVFMTKNLC